jgi:hypothetical protein
MSTKIVTIPIKNLKVNLFVRQGLDQNRVIFLGELLEGGTELPPIKITSDFILIDGRHRIEAYDLIGRTEIKAEIVSDVRNETDLITMAYLANVGGALPPTKEDTEHTILLLLERNVAVKQIGERLGLPASVARKYINEVRSRAARLKLQKAAAGVTEGGLTVAKAAEQYEVEPEKLKEHLSGTRRKSKNGVEEIQRCITGAYKSLSMRNSSLIRTLINKYEDGDVTEKQVREIFEHLDDVHKRAARVIMDWKNRFESANRKAAA